MTVNTDLAVFAVFAGCRNRFSLQVFIELHVNRRVAACILVDERLDVRTVIVRVGFCARTLYLNRRSEFVRLHAARVGVKLKTLVRQAVGRVLQVRYVNGTVRVVRISRVEFIQERSSRLVGDRACYVVQTHRSRRRVVAVVHGRNNIRLRYQVALAFFFIIVEVAVVMQIYLRAVRLRVRYGKLCVVYDLLRVDCQVILVVR